MLTQLNARPGPLRAVSTEGDGWSGRGRRRATADGLGDAVVSLGAGSRGFLAMVMTSLPRRLEARSRLVKRFHVRELLHVRFPPQTESFCSHLLLHEMALLFIFAILQNDTHTIDSLDLLLRISIGNRSNIHKSLYCNNPSSRTRNASSMLKVKRRDDKRYFSHVPEATLSGDRISDSCA